MTLRAKLMSFRVEAFSSENRSEGGDDTWDVQLKHEIEVGVAVPTAPGGVIQAVLKVRLTAFAHSAQKPTLTAAFQGAYAGRFFYPEGSAEAEVLALMNDPAHQYMLSAQVFPLAMTHFRRELLATGFDARHLPLGF